MKYVVGINGSPRKKWNTATMIEHALKGAEAAGARTELVNLYDLNFKGCISCFACKLRNGKSYGRCAVRDDLTPILEKIEKADAIVIGSPIYIGETTSSTRAFIERLLFPFVKYEGEVGTLFDRKISVGLVYTLGAKESWIKQMGYDQPLAMAEKVFQRVMGSGETLAAVDTMQFDDYAKYVSGRFDPAEKKRIHDEQFPLDCAKAFEMGKRFGSVS